MRALLTLLAKIGQNWLLWSLMDLFTEESEAWSWRDDYTAQECAQGGLEVLPKGSAEPFLIARLCGEVAQMRLVDGAELPAEFSQVFQAIGLSPELRHWELDLEVLDHRLSACDGLSRLVARAERLAPGQGVEIAQQIATLAQEYVRFRWEAHESPDDHVRQAAAAGIERTTETCNRVLSQNQVIRSWKLHEDPRGSAFTIRFADQAQAECEVMGFNIDWSPAVVQKPPQEAGEVDRFKVRASKLKTDVLAALSCVRVEGKCVFLPAKLSKKVYDAVNVTLNALGGKWHTGKQAHVFEKDPTPLLDAAIETASVFLPSDFEFFETQAREVNRLIRLAAIEPGHLVLEPQAGAGALALAAAKIVGIENVVCYELMPENAAALAALGFLIDGPRDFLAVKPEPIFDRVVCNPPFSGGRDIAHVTHALGFLKPGGTLTAIMSTTWMDRTTSATRQFKALLSGMLHTVEKIDAGAFAAVGTQVPTVLLHCCTPPAAAAVQLAEAERLVWPDVPVPVAKPRVARPSAQQEQLVMF